MSIFLCMFITTIQVSFCQIRHLQNYSKHNKPYHFSDLFESYGTAYNFNVNLENVSVELKYYFSTNQTAKLLES